MTQSEQLYNSLLNKGYTEKNLGDRDTFLTKMQDKENRRKLYDFISKRGDFRIGNYENYEQRIAADYLIPQPLQENIAIAKSNPMDKVNPALRTQSTKPIGDVQASQNIGNKAALTFEDVEPMPEASAVLQRNADTLAGLNAPSGLPKSPDNIQQAVSQDLIGQAASQEWQRDTEQHYKSEKERLQALYNKEMEKVATQPAPNQFFAPGMVKTPENNRTQSREAYLLQQAIQYINDAEHHMSNVRNNAGLAQGISDAIFDIDTLTLGLDSLSKNTTLKAILDKADADQPLTEAEESLLNAALYKQFTEAALPNGRWYNVGKGIGEQVPYMLEFALSGGVAGALTKGASKAIGKQVVKYINNLALKNGSKIAKRTARNVFTRGSRMLGNTLYQLPGGVMRAAVQVPLRSSVYNNIIERQIGTLGYNPGEDGTLDYTGRIGADNTADAITKGLISGFITNLTESSFGEGIQFITNKIGGLMGKGISAVAKDFRSPRWYNRLRESFRRNGFGEFVKATSWQGPVAEWGEEILDQTLNAIFVGDSSLDPNSENYVFDLDNLIDTAITTGAISLFMGAAGGLASGKIHRDVNKAYALAKKNIDTLHYTDTEINALNNIATSRPQEASKWVSSITRTMRALAIRSAEIENSLSPEARTLLSQPYTEAEFNELSPYDQQAVMALTEINSRFNDLTIQRDYVVAGINYNALIKGLKESVAPQAEAVMADIQANALRDSDYTIKVKFKSQDGYLVSGTADIDNLPDGRTVATLPAGNIYQVRTKSPDGQWIIQQAVAEDIVPGSVTPTQQLIDETTARIYTPVQNLINAEQAQAQAEVAQSTEQTTPTTEQTQPTTPADTKDTTDVKDSTVSTTTTPIVEQTSPIVEQASPIVEQASPILDSPTSSVIGRSLSADESQNLIAQMEQNAEVAPEVELTPENWISLFGEDGTVDTPIGSVKMGENQYLKLFKKNRAQYLGMIKPTLSNPDIVLEEYDPKDNAERESKYLFVKTFIKADGSRYVHFESVTVKKDNLEVAISSHEVNEPALTKKVQQSKLLHLNSKFLNSDGRLIEPLNEGSDLVPTPNSVSDSNKSVSTDKDSERRENNNILDENVLSTLKEDIENLRAKAETIEYELDYLADNINGQLGYDFRGGIDLYEKTFIKLGSNKLKTLKWFRDNVSDNKEYPNLIFDFAKTLNQIYILETQLERADEQFDEHIASLPTSDAINAITQRRGANEADQYAQWRKGILTKERDKAQKALNAKVKPFDASRYPDYAQMKREERKYNEALQATRSEALGIINRTTAEIADIDRYLADRNRQIATEREAENPLRNGIAQAVEKQPINTIEQYIARYIALGGRLRMTDQYTNGLSAELGITPGSQEHRELLSILSNTEGMTPEQLAQDMAENIEPEYRHLVAGRDTQDIRNAIIDTIQSGVTSRKKAYDFIADINQRAADEEQRYYENMEVNNTDLQTEETPETTILPDALLPSETTPLRTVEQPQPTVNDTTQAKLAHIASWQQAIDVPIVIFHDISEVDNPQAVANIQAGNTTPGWIANDTVYIYLPQAKDERDIDATIMHECIAHFGIPRLFATQEQADAFYNEVWNIMPEAEQYRFLSYPGVSHLKGEKARRAAADEYIAHLAEQIRAKRAGEAEVSLWQRIVAFFRNALRRANVNLRLNDTDLTQLLLQSLDALKKNNERPQETTPDNALDANEVAVTLPSNGTETRFSIRSFREEGRAKVTNWLDSKVADKDITRQEAQDILDQLDTIYDICQEYTTQYAPFGDWSEAQVNVDANGNPVLSVIKSNGEYAMNLDFSLVCKKRRTLDAVFQEMIARDIINDFELDGVQVAKVNEIIRSYGFETACRICFVDSKRFRIAAVADTFVKLYNELSSMSDRDLRKILSAEPKTVRGKAAQLLLNDPSQRIKVSRSDFMSAEGFERIKRDYPAIMKLYNSKKGSGGPKASFGDVQYLNDIENTSWTPDNAYAVGGVRLQSFSDYVPRMVFDYVQMIADLAAKRLPVHAYTKEDIFAKQFGLTGIKINLSLVPRVDPDGIAPGLDRDGNYVWQEGETFPYDTAIAIQNAPGYRDNCGTIAVGVSDAHILKMLDDENIRMVIPYHKSGLNPAVAKFNRIGKFVDYTLVQSTRYANGKNLSIEDLKTHFNFNEALRIANGNPRIAAQQYLDWCRENNYLPKFDKFASHPNYYKLLEDFTTMYTVDGVDTVVPQHAVEMRFPTEQDAFGSMRDLIAEGLEADAILEGQRNEQLPAIVDEIAATLPPKTKTKTKAKTKTTDIRFSSKSPEEQDIIDRAKANGTYLLAPNGQPTNLTPRQWAQVRTRAFKEWFGEWESDPQNASKIVDENGEPMVVTHYSPNKFTIFDTQKIGSTTDYGAFGKGFYFSPNMPEFRSFYGNERYDVYLNIKNPLILDDIEEIWQIRNDKRYADNLRFNSDKIQSEGYDGTVYINEQNGKILNHELIAFSPNQIKSATDNIGTFDSNNPDIRFRIGNNEQTTLLNAKQPKTSQPLVDTAISDTRFRVTKRTRETINTWLNKRTDLDNAERNAFWTYIENEEPAKQLAMGKWFANGSIRLPEDQPTVDDAMRMARKMNVDPLKYNAPGLITSEYHERFGTQEQKEKLLSPEDERFAGILTDKVDYGNGITVYTVQDDAVGQDAVRELMNDHLGKNFNCWCLLYADANGNITESARNTYWKRYDSIPKRVAFKDGKICSFCASNNRRTQWWDLSDRSYGDNIPVEMELPGDAYNRRSLFEFSETSNEFSLVKNYPIFRGNKKNGRYEEWYNEDTHSLAIRANFKGGKIEGRYEEWFENGQPRVRANYKGGERDSLYEEWFENGQPRVRANYKDGERDGLYEEWYKNGQLSMRADYKNGRKDGSFEEWYKNGQLSRRADYKGGLYEEWYENGQPSVRANYKGGERDGLYEEWYENGQLSMRANYKDDEFDGLYEEWYENGQIQEQTTFKYGKRNGTRTLWYLNGQIQEQSNYLNDHLDGFNFSWDTKGNIKEINKFEKDYLLYKYGFINGEIATRMIKGYVSFRDYYITPEINKTALNISRDGSFLKHLNNKYFNRIYLREVFVDGYRYAVGVYNTNGDLLEAFGNTSYLDDAPSILPEKDIIPTGQTSFRSINPGESLTDYARAVVVNGQQASTPTGINTPVALATANDKNKLPDTPIRFRMTRRTESTVTGWINRRTDLTPDERKAVIDHIDNLDGTTLQLATAKWFAQGTIRIPEDNIQVEQAIKVASRAKVDPLAYDYPQAIISAFPDMKPKGKPINPDDVPTLTNKQELPNGLTVYNVDESRESQQAIRDIIDTHLGTRANPWCITSALDGNLTDESWEYWESYSAYPKRIAFHDGKVVALFASDSAWPIWWDTQDRPHYGIPLGANITDGEYNEETNTINTFNEDGEIISSTPANTSFRSINPGESLTDYARAVVVNSQQTTTPTGLNALSGSANTPETRFRSIAADNRTADIALDSIEQATADYAGSLNAERGAIIDAITPAPDDSPSTVARKVMFRSIGGELITRDNTELENFLALANNISNAMAENDARHKHTAIAESQYDSMQRLHNLIDDLRKQGALIDERFDPWLTQNQARSRAQAETKVFDLTYRQPLYEAIARGIRALFPGINTKDKAENAKGYSHLSLYAQARTAIERQAIKSAQARAEAEEKGEEYKEKDFGGLAGIQEAIFGLYSAIDNDVEAAKGNIEKLTALATERGIPTVQEYIDNAEAKLGNPDTNGTAAHQLWTAIRSISAYQLTYSYNAGLTSRAGYQTLTYGRNIDALLREKYDMQVKQIKDNPGSYDNVTDYDKDGNATGTRKVLNDNARIALDKLNQEYADAIDAVPMPGKNGNWQQLIDTGWLTEEDVNSLHRYYMYYMPLKGHAELTAEDIVEYENKTPRNQSKIKAVEGHSHLAKDPFNQLILDTHGAIQNAEQNRWRLNLYNILTNNPNPSQYVVEQRFYKIETQSDGSKEYVPYGELKTINGAQVFIPGRPTAEELANGTAVSYNNRFTRAEVDIPIRNDQRKEHSVTVMVDGEAYNMFFYDKRIADAINGTNIKRPSDWWKQLDKLQALNRLYAGLKTSLNPTFTLISNLPRDWMEMVSNNLIEHGFAHAVTSFIYRVRATRAGDVQAALRKYQDGKLLTLADATTDVERYVVEFFNNGGSVNITQLPDYNTAKVELMDDLNTYMRTGEMPKGGWLSRNFNNMAERVELAPRIATYIASRTLGRNISQSVNDAKEATVNFDRKGSWSGIMGMFQLFYNASAQSVRRQIGLARRHPVRFAATYATIGFLSPLNNIMMSYIMSMLLGDDDDLENIVRNYFAINPELRRRYNIILIGNDYIRIPMAVNYLPYVTLGDVIANWRLNPNYRPNILKDTIDIAAAILDTFTPSMFAQPIGFAFDAITAKNNEESANTWRSFAGSLGSTGIGFFVGRAIEPLMQSLGNYNFMGSTLFDMPYDKNSQEPAYLRARQYTQPVWVWASHLLNDITGGNEVHAGWLNIAPEQIENVMTVFGGYGEYAENIISIGIETVSFLSGKKPDTEVFKKSFPLLSRLYGGNTQERYDKSMQSMFYDDTTALAGFNEYRKNATTPSTRADFDSTYSPDEQRYFADLNTMQTIAKRIRTEIKAATPEGEAPKYHEDERLKAIYNLANEQYHSLASGEYKPIDNPYYTYMYIKDAIEKAPHRTTDGTYRLIDRSERSADSRGHLKQLLRSFSKTRSMYKALPSGYYPGMPLDNREEQALSRFNTAVGELIQAYRNTDLDNLTPDNNEQ